MNELKPQEVRICLRETSSDCSIHLGDTDITHLVNEIRVESKAGQLTKVFLGMAPRSTMVSVHGKAFVEQIVPDGDKA